jgi:hypothetical protein
MASATASGIDRSGLRQRYKDPAKEPLIEKESIPPQQDGSVSISLIRVN